MLTKFRAYIVYELDIVSVHALSSVCRIFRESFLHILESRSDAFWEQYGPAHIMRDIIHRTGGLASGSAVLHHLRSCPADPPICPPDLDLFAAGDNAVTVFSYLLFHCGYEIHPHGPWSTHLTKFGVRGSSCLRKIANHDVVINVYSTTDNPITTILSFDATIVMNFVTDTTLYCMYPGLWRTAAGVLQATAARQDFFIEDLVRKGYPVYEDNSQFGHCTSFCPRRPRCISDGAYLMIPVAGRPVDVLGPFPWEFQSGEICTSFSCPLRSTDPADELLDSLWIAWDSEKHWSEWR